MPFPTRLASLILLAGLAAASPALAQVACPELPARQPMPPTAVPATVPIPYWRERVEELDRVIAATDLSRIQLLFLGDSITQGWFPSLFQQFYGHRAPLNLGVGTDGTQGLLWRLNRLPLGTTLRPRLAVVLIGTNNLLFASPDDVALGVAENIRLIRQRSPATRILLVGLLPRGASGADPLRASIAQVNARIARCADNRSVFYAEPGPMMVDASGTMSNQIAFDYLHPTMVGYAILSAALEPQIRALLGH
ncbi:GDSL-like protein [Acetobacteraceae bacterium AT-5844]|nr:GDSL-like protein [Acetobacteraceae bacterium AT-5844]